MSGLILPGGQPAQSGPHKPGPGEPGYGDAIETVSPVARKVIEKMQSRIKDNRCAYCGLRCGADKVRVIQKEVELETPTIIKLVRTTTFKRETWVKCPKCGPYTLNFGPDTELTTGTKLEEDNII